MTESKPRNERPRIAAVITEYRRYSHAQPWQTADLDRPIQVGAEVAPEEDGTRVALSGANQSCSRCQLIIGEFEAVRIFARPQGRKGEMYFHEKCVGNLRVADE